MKYNKAVILAVLALLSVFPTKAQTPTVVPSRAEYIKSVYDSVFILYAQTETGGMKMLCTGTVYRKYAATKDVPQHYRLASASHCVDGESDDQQKNSEHYFFSPDSKGAKTFYPAKVIGSGNKSAGDDFSIFEIATDAELSVIPLGDEGTLAIGDKVINVASPLGLGKQFFEGFLSAPLIDRPPLDAGEVTWRDVILFRIGIGGGSSGSAIVSDQQRAIVAFMVGHFTSAEIGSICLPVSKFKAYEKSLDDGSYKIKKRESLLERFFGKVGKE